MMGFSAAGAASFNKKFQSTAGSAVFFRGHFLSKFSVLAKFIVYLPAATEFGVIPVVLGRLFCFCLIVVEFISYI